MGHAKVIHPINEEIRANLLSLRSDGLKKGKWSGFADLYDHYTVKEGGTTYFIAPPAVGKTAITYELTMNLAEYEGCKVAIFTPETGSPVDVYNELLWAKLREPFLKHNGGKKTEKEVNEAIDWVADHFFVIDPMHLDLTANSYFKAIIDLEEERDIKIDIAVIDPMTELDIYGEGARDLALGNFLTRVRRFSSMYKIHTMIAFHTKAIQLVEGTDVNGQKVRFYPPPQMSDIAGGEMASRKGLFILGLWRPPLNVIDVDTGLPYKANETRIEILKAKPKALGKVGKVSLHYDIYSSRYYQLGEGDKPIWSSPKPYHMEDK